MSILQVIPQYGITGVAAGLVVAWGLASVVAGKFLALKNLNGYRLLLLASATFLFAVSFEIIANGAYEWLFGKQLWQYQLYPTHGGSTSLLAVFFWPLYGVYLYFLHEAIKIRRWHTAPRWKRGVWAGLDGPLIEIILNAFFLLVHQTFFFYYFPGDVFHFTTLQIVPVYAVGGVILAYMLHYLEHVKRRWLLPVACYAGATGIVFLGLY